MLLQITLIGIFGYFQYIWDFGYCEIFKEFRDNISEILKMFENFVNIINASIQDTGLEKTTRETAENNFKMKIISYILVIKKNYPRG